MALFDKPCTKCGEVCSSQDEFTEHNDGQRWPMCSGCDPACREDDSDADEHLLPSLDVEGIEPLPIHFGGEVVLVGIPALFIPLLTVDELRRLRERIDLTLAELDMVAEGTAK